MSENQYPSDWLAIPIGRIGRVVTGNTPPKADAKNYGFEVPWASPADISGGKYVTKTRNSLSLEGAKLARVVPAGSVLVTCIASLGKNAIAASALCTNQQINTVVVDERFSNEYVYYCIEHHGVPLLQKYAGRTAVPIVSKGLFEQLELPFPQSKIEQQKIAAILTAVDDMLDVIARQIEATQTLKQGLMQTLFSRGVGTQDATGCWVAHTEFKNSELGEIPAGWDCLPLGQLLTEKPEYGANASAVPYSDENRIRYLRITDIDEYGNLRDDSIKAILNEAAQHYILSDGDLLIARSGNTVGKSIQYRSAMGTCAFAGYLLRFRFNQRALVEYVAAYLMTQAYWAWVKASVKVGAQPNINAQQYQSMQIPVPPIEEQYRIAQVVGGFDAKIQSLRVREANYQSLMRGLMQKLLTGEWRVSLGTHQDTTIAA
jgi:type I restriction enzyme S subunit